MSTPWVNNEITNAAKGDNNRHVVNTNIGSTLVTNEKVENINGVTYIVHNYAATATIAQSTSRSIVGPIENSLQIVSRSDWGAKSPTFPMDYLEKPVGRVIICHTVTDNEEDTFKVMQLCRSMQNYHFDQKFGDIAYNFLIGCDGKVYEGRGFNTVGTHTLGHNRTSLGIAFIGDFREKLPPSVSFDVCKALLKMGVAAGHIAPNYELLGQCDVVAHEGPGRMLHRELHRLRQ